MSEQWIWFVAGFVPYYLSWGCLLCGVWVFEVRALFWRLRIEHWPRDGGGWVLQVPLIEHLKDAVWAVVLLLSKHGSQS